MNYLDLATKIEPDLIQHRRWLHSHPEVGRNCVETFRYIQNELNRLNIEYKTLGDAGIMADIGKGDKTILLRADMDALPMKEESGLPFASKRNCAHTCGHDMHTAALLGTARLLKENEKTLTGRVRLMFQADEEGLSGAKAMIEQGVLEGVDAGFGLHVVTGDPEPGKIIASPGPFMASSNIFRITVTGHGCHGASPHVGVDPINVCCHIHTSLQALIAREINIQQPAVITIGKFQGGDAANIIPNQCEMMGTLRTFNKEQQILLKRRIKEIAESTAAMFGATCHFEYISETMPLVNHPELTEAFLGYLKEFMVVEPGAKAMGSEDFAYITDAVPACFFRLGAGGSDPMYHEGGGHHPKVRFNEEALKYGTAALCTVADRWLKENS